MDKRIILAVAGSGKTQYILNTLNENSKSIIITYTQNNTDNIKRRILKKFGVIPDGVRVYTYFSFLMSFCFRPLFKDSHKYKGINYKNPERYTTKNRSEHYFDKSNRIYHSRISKLFLEYNMIDDILVRIAKYFENLIIDEVQDFASSDFNFLMKITNGDYNSLLVGDFYQHTFSTSNDGNINKNLYNNIDTYRENFKKHNFIIDQEVCSLSYRCSPDVCEFITNNLNIIIKSNREDSTEIKLLECLDEIDKVMMDDTIVKLFYQSSSKYKGHTSNWGETKGLDDFINVCVILNANTLKLYKERKLNDLAALTKNKFYVACTRTKGNLYFIPEKLISTYKY